MKIKELVSHIARKEGLKSVVKVGDIREIVSIISDVLVSDNGETILKLVENGKRRRVKKALTKKVRK